jgi:hypothetical protein
MTPHLDRIERRDRALPSRDCALPSRDCALPSRDRKRAVPLLLVHPNRHRLPLSLNHITNSCGNLLPIPQPTRTAMSRPPFAIWPLRTNVAQLPACVRLEISHHLLRLGVRFHHYMDVVGPHMRRQQRPGSMQANLANRIQHRTAGDCIQQVRPLIHQIALARRTRPIAFNQSMSRNIVVPIHGTGFVAVQMRTIAGERNQVRHTRLFYTALSRSRLGKERSRLGKERSRLGTFMQHFKDNLFA